MAYQQNLKGENGKNASFSALSAGILMRTCGMLHYYQLKKKNEKESHSTTASVWLEVPGEEEDVSYIFLQC